MTEPQGIEETQRAQDQGRTLYVVATSHLDTQWLWTIQTTIDEYIPATLRDNFALFERFPNYVFSFEGAFRYMLAKEYYPEDYARLKEYIGEGRWHVCGSSVDAGDVNIPSPESLNRHILYGNGFFKREFGETSCDIYLPDCFGFGYALPSVAAHCGLKGFSTQKLTWGSSVGIPFDVAEGKDADGNAEQTPVGIGVWEGVDGSTVVASLNPGSYVSAIEEDLSRNEQWLVRINKLGGTHGAYVGYKYFGVGDRGGAPDKESVSWLEKSTAGDGAIRVISAPADQLYHDLTPEQIAKLPRYKGELLMTRHGVGCYTSQAAMKRWNRKNEQLADAAERAAVAADWLGGAIYPQEKLTKAWIRFLWHQFHDDLTGTSIPEAYTFSWNDEIISLNHFAEVLSNSAGAVSRAMDTRSEGVPLVIYNPLSIEREDVVEVTVRFPERAPKAVRVYDADGEEVPSQIGAAGARELQVVFVARAPSVGFAVYDVRQAETPCEMATGLTVTRSELENARYRVRLDEQGDVASVFDKASGRELLAAPARLQLLKDEPDYWPEWEISYEDIVAALRTYVSGPAQLRIAERGPARVVLEVARQAGHSVFVQRIRLGAGGAADRVELDTRVDWRTPRTLLKAAFPLAVFNERATYDLGLGTVQRGNNHEELYEVPAQQWADITAADGSYGVAIMNDCKYGWDKPGDNTLRLTLIHSPDCIEKDMGHHKFLYALSGHCGDWRDGGVQWQAARLNQPLIAFQTSPHRGTLGKRFSLLRVNTPQVAVRTVKNAEAGDEIVVRFQELHGSSVEGVRLEASVRVVAAREVTGAEEPIDGDFTVEDGGLTLDMQAYRPRTFALTLAPPAAKLVPPVCKTVGLPFDADVVSLDGEKSGGDFDGRGHSLPGELLPATIVAEGIPFAIGPTEPGKNNTLICRGQRINLPEGKFNRAYLLAAAADGDTRGTFVVGHTAVELTIQGLSGFVGQSQSLIIGGRRVGPAHMAEPFIKRDPVAWVGTHRHTADGRNEPYVFCYLYKYGFDLPAGAEALTLPDNTGIHVFGLTLADNPNDETFAVGDLYDRILAPKISPKDEVAVSPISVAMSVDEARAEIRYTLDGNEPTAASRLYTTPIALMESAIVKARSFVDGRPDDYVACRRYTIVQPRKAAPSAAMVSGMDYRYFEGEWDRLPDFEVLEPVKTGTTDRIDLSPRLRDEHFGMEFTGFVNVPYGGVYTFTTRSDNGSRLFIGGVKVVDNESWRFLMMERCGSVALAAGCHPIKVQYFQGGGDAGLEVHYEGPGTPKHQIPRSALYRHQSGR